jgi:TRAP-type C4-dicarboxylate transport system substrate-binding protein
MYKEDKTLRRPVQIMCLLAASALLLGVLFAAGCASPSGGATEEVNWKWNSLQPKDVNWIARVEEGAFQEVSARTDGKFTIDFYGSSALGVDPPSLIQAVGDGLLDCSEMFGVHVLGEWPVSSLLDYPGVLPWDPEMKQEIAAAIFPILEESLAERNIVLWFADFVEPRNVYTVDRADSLSDFKGMKIRAAGTSDVVQAEGIGATAVPTPYSEVYTALERGILDGHITTNDATWTLGFHELEGYMYETHLGGVHTYGIINKDRWDALPSEYQQVLRDVAKEYIAPTWLDEIQGAIDHGRDEILGSGVVHMNDENPDLVEEMRVATAANCEGPLLEMLAKAGPEGEEAMKIAREIVEDYGYTWRFPNVGK